MTSHSVFYDRHGTRHACAPGVAISPLQRADPFHYGDSWTAPVYACGCRPLVHRFKCERCEKWAGWCYGADDDLPRRCDDCWAHWHEWNEDEDDCDDDHENNEMNAHDIDTAPTSTADLTEAEIAQIWRTLPDAQREFLLRPYSYYSVKPRARGTYAQMVERVAKAGLVEHLGFRMGDEIPKYTPKGVRVAEYGLKAGMGRHK